MKIGLDAMGGDVGPEVTVNGGLRAAKGLGVEVVLVGDERQLNPLLALEPDLKGLVSVVHSSQVVGMTEQPTIALREKPRSSIMIGIGMVESGHADAFVSAGNTGAVVAAAYSLLGRIPGILRPAIGLIYSTMVGRALFLDAGANPDCRARMLVQFGRMGSLYMERVFGVEKPRVALLNIGEESTKGNRLVKEAYPLLMESGLHFVGNIEGEDVYEGIADVVVTDGFTGNVALKLSEGLSGAISRSLKQQASAGPQGHGQQASMIQDALRDMMGNWDYSGLGGAYLLGVKGNVVIAHGRSNPEAISNAVGFAKRAVEEQGVTLLSEAGGWGG